MAEAFDQTRPAKENADEDANADVTQIHSHADKAMGERIRILRRERSLSLVEVSQRTGYSIGYLSQIERGLSSPSLRTMVALGEAFGIGLSGLFSQAPAKAMEEGNGVVMRAAERGRMDLWRTGLDKAILTPHDDSFGLDLYLMKLAPGGFSDEDFFAHAGEEAGVVLEGSMELNLAGQLWTLEAGDSFRFASHRAHRYRNPSTTKPAQILWSTYTPMDPASGARAPRKPIPIQQNEDGTFEEKQK